MDKMFHFGAIEVPQELQNAVSTAHGALIEKRNYINRLKEGLADIEADITNARDELEAVNKSHMEGLKAFASGATALPAAAKGKKARIAEIGGRIVGLEAMLPDFSKEIRTAESEMFSLDHAYNQARRNAIKAILARVPRHGERPGDLRSIVDFIENGESIDLGTAMMMFLAVHNVAPQEAGAPFPHGALNPVKFFTFLSQFFRAPTPEEYRGFLGRLDLMVWGDNEPVCRVEMPGPYKSKLPPVGWDAGVSGLDLIHGVAGEAD